MTNFSFSKLNQELIPTLVGALLWIPFGITIIPVYSILFILCFTVHLLAKIFRSNLIPITRVDSHLAFAPSNTKDAYVYACQVWKVNGEVKVDEFRDFFYNTLLSSEVNRRKYANLYCHFVTFLGYIFKKREHSIDLCYHIQGLELDDGQTLEEFLGTWMVRHDDDSGGREGRPDWRIKIISHADGASTVLFKLHHGLCDGYTMVHLVGMLSGSHAPYTFKEPLPSYQILIKHFIQFPYLLLKYWLQMIRYCKSSPVPRLASTSNSNEKWFISFGSLDLQTVKEIRRATNTHFAAVLMSVQVGALRRLLQETVQEQNRFLDKNHEIYFGSPMGWPNHPVMVAGGGMGNHLTLTVLKGSLIETPHQRLLEIEKQLKSQAYQILCFYGLFTILKLQPSWINRLLFKWRLLGLLAGDMALSVLRCSSEQHSLLGMNVENLFLPVVPLSPFRNLKLLTVPVSHSGALDVSVNASSALVKDQGELDRLIKNYFPLELEELRKAIEVDREHRGLVNIDLCQVVS